MLHKDQVSSPEAIKESIKVDWHIFAWFSSLIRDPAIQQSLKNDSAASLNYRSLDETTKWQSVFYGTAFMVMVFSMIFDQRLLLSLLLPLWAILAKLESAKRSLVSELGIRLIHQDFTAEEITHMTLFQICEAYTKKTGIPSLVKKISGINVILRNALIITFVTTVFIHPLTFLESALCLLLAYLGVIGVFQFKFFYDRIR